MTMNKQTSKKKMEDSFQECFNCGCQRATHPIPECEEFVEKPTHECPRCGKNVSEGAHTCRVKKQTPEEKCKHQWFWHWDENYASCMKCGVREKSEGVVSGGRSPACKAGVEADSRGGSIPSTPNSPSPEARCEHNWGSWAGEKFEHNKCCLCGAYKVPPEARVDWEKEAREILGVWIAPFNPETVNRVAKALSAAFEKGREAR